MAKRSYVDTGEHIPTGDLLRVGYKYKPEAHKDAKLTDITIYTYHRPGHYSQFKRIEAYTYIYPEYKTKQNIVETYTTGGSDLEFSETSEEPLGGAKETLGV